MPRITPRIATAAAALAAALAVPAGPAAGAPGDTSPCPGADAAPTTKTPVATAAVVLCLVNHERRSRGLPPLRDERHLRKAAQGQARALSASRRPPRSSAAGAHERISASGYARGRGFVFAEALGHGTRRTSTPAQRVDGWLRSRQTRAVLLSPDFRDGGVAVATRRARATYVLELGGPARKRR